MRLTQGRAQLQARPALLKHFVTTYYASLNDAYFQGTLPAAYVYVRAQKSRFVCRFRPQSSTSTSPSRPAGLPAIHVNPDRCLSLQQLLVTLFQEMCYVATWVHYGNERCERRWKLYARTWRPDWVQDLLLGRQPQPQPQDAGHGTSTFRLTKSLTPYPDHGSASCSASPFDAAHVESESEPETEPARCLGITVPDVRTHHLHLTASTRPKRKRAQV